MHLHVFMLSFVCIMAEFRGQSSCKNVCLHHLRLQQPLDPATTWYPPEGCDTILGKPKITFGALLGSSHQKISPKLKKHAFGGFLEETSQKARARRRFVAAAILENDAPV